MLGKLNLVRRALRAETGYCQEAIIFLLDVVFIRFCGNRGSREGRETHEIGTQNTEEAFIYVMHCREVSLVLFKLRLL